jgi:membrane-associated protein
MAESLFELLRGYLLHYGYWTVAAALLLENAGLPVPGETVLLLASFLAHAHQGLQLSWIIVIGTCAATLGDNIGFAVGHFGGRPLLDRYRAAFRIPGKAVERGERLFEKFGAVAIFFARFVFGMRVIAGPLAGVLRMHWKKFAIFNFLGALLWVTTISLVGYVFGRNAAAVGAYLKRADILIAVLAVAACYVWWRYGRNSAREAQK